MKFTQFSEYVTHVTIETWLVNDGDFVEKGQSIAEVLVEWEEDGEDLETTLELDSEESGIVKILKEVGFCAEIDSDVVCLIDTSFKKSKPRPLKYFLPEISPYSPIKANCPSCQSTTNFSSHIRLNTSERAIYLWYYQCQSCGKLETSDESDLDGIRVGLENPCECGGQFRRDKNIFCPSCKYRKSDENKREDKLYATPEELESIKMSHGTEEMISDYNDENIDSKNSEERIEEDSDFKKLCTALREICKGGNSFNFGFSQVPKGPEYSVDKGLNESMESELIYWMDDHLAPESNYHSTDYELSIDDDGISLKCTATWGGWLYDDLHSIEELFTEEIIQILLPDYEYENVNLDSLSVPFQYTDDDNGYGFNWLSDVAEYYDEEKDLNLEIPLKDLKQTLEPIFHDILSDFCAEGSVDQDGLMTKIVTVEDGTVTVEESICFELFFSLDDD